MSMSLEAFANHGQVIQTGDEISYHPDGNGALWTGLVVDIGDQVTLLIPPPTLEEQVQLELGIATTTRFSRERIDRDHLLRGIGGEFLRFEPHREI